MAKKDEGAVQAGTDQVNVTVTDEQAAATGLSAAQVAVILSLAKEHAATMLADHLAQDHQTPAAPALPGAAPAVMQGPVDVKYLKGLVYRTSKPKKGGPNDDDATVHVPVERDLTPEDVLAWRDLGDSVKIVAADGQTYTVKK